MLRPMRLTLLTDRPLSRGSPNCRKLFLRTRPHADPVSCSERISPREISYHTVFLNTCKAILLSAYCIFSSVHARS